MPRAVQELLDAIFERKMLPRRSPGPSKIVLPSRRELNFQKMGCSRKVTEKEPPNEPPEGLLEPLGEPPGALGRLKNEPGISPRRSWPCPKFFWGPPGPLDKRISGLPGGKKIG